jgi:glycosyltransferase involved in cell wall biosynthesis
LVRDLKETCKDWAGTLAVMVDVVLPVLNEARALPWVLARMPERYAPIVVDNGSADDSADIAEDLGALVVREPKQGFGAACFAGLQACGVRNSIAGDRRWRLARIRACSSPRRRRVLVENHPGGRFERCMPSRMEGCATWRSGSKSWRSSSSE